MMTEFLERFLLVFTSLFVVVEPIGTIPIFLGLTKNYDVEKTKRTALKSVLFGGMVLVFFSLFGNYIFKFLQINLSAFKAAGGVLLFLTALDMLRTPDVDCRCSPAEKNSSDEGHDISYVPLGIPLLAGPGAITTAMVFSEDHIASHTYHFLVLLLATTLVFLISYFVLRHSLKLKSLLGESGMTVIQRLMGLILAAISLQFFVSGALTLYQISLN